jgi:hypothetical protein
MRAAAYQAMIKILQMAKMWLPATALWRVLWDVRTL